MTIALNVLLFVVGLVLTLLFLLGVSVGVLVVVNMRRMLRSAKPTNAVSHNVENKEKFGDF